MLERTGPLVRINVLVDRRVVDRKVRIGLMLGEGRESTLSRSPFGRVMDDPKGPANIRPRWAGNRMPRCKWTHCHHCPLRQQSSGRPRMTLIDIEHFTRN